MPFVLLLVFLLYVVVVATCYSSRVVFLHYYCYSCCFLACHCCLGYFFALLLLFVLCSHIAMLFALFSCTSIVFLLFALPTCIALVACTTFLRFQSSWVIVAIVVVTIVFLVLPFHIVTLLMSFLSHYSSHIIIFLALLFLFCFFSRIVVLLVFFFLALLFILCFFSRIVVPFPLLNLHYSFYCAIFWHYHSYHVDFFALSFFLCCHSSCIAFLALLD